MTTIMQPFQCDLQPQIQETHRTTHAGTTTRCITQRRNQFADETTAAAPAAHTRYLSSPAEATLHRKKTRFRAPAFSPKQKAHATFMQPLQCILQHSLHHHFPSSPLPFLTTSLRHHFPKSPLPFVTTLCHSQVFFCDVLLCDVKSHTTLHQCQFFCDVLLSDVKSHTILHQCQFFCDVLLCDVEWHTTLSRCQFF